MGRHFHKWETAGTQGGNSRRRPLYNTFTMESLYMHIQDARDLRRVAEATEPQRIQAAADAYAHDIARELMKVPRGTLNAAGEWCTQVTVEVPYVRNVKKATPKERYDVVLATLQRRLDASGIRVVRYRSTENSSWFADMLRCLTLGFCKLRRTETVTLVLDLKRPMQTTSDADDVDVNFDECSEGAAAGTDGTDGATERTNLIRARSFTAA